ncbi:MAG: hypothetical protein NXI20_08110 [bacterium]|nr:hypothetical protein [bacterium]
MRKLVMPILLSILIPVSLMAQDDVDRPANIGDSEFDNFKNTSFDIREESFTLRESVTKIDEEIKNYSGVMNTIGVEKLKGNFKALLDTKTAIATIVNRIGELDNQSKDLLQNAKSLKPKTKSLKATKNTNASVKGLKLAKTDLDAVKEMLSANIELLTNELKSRGEPIE